MNSDDDLSFDYSDSYFQSGMVGWHGLSFPLISARFEKFCQGRRFAKGLDFGCGDGFYGSFLRLHVEELHGTDVSNCIEDAGSRAAYHEFTQNDLGQPLRAEFRAYDVIFSSEVIEHISDYRQFLRNAFGLLNPDGTLFLTTTTYACGLPIYLIQNPQGWSLIAVKQFIKGFLGNETARTIFLKNIWEWTKGHHHGFSKRQLRTALCEVGFEVETIEYFHAQPFIYTQFFWNPFRKSRYRWLIIPVARILGCTASAINYTCRIFNIYAPNVVVVAKKSSLLK